MKCSRAVKERPIIFSAPMVRAIVDGRKTQTRRVIKPQPGNEDSMFTSIRCDWYYPTVVDRHGEEQPAEHPVYGFADDECGWPCRYGGPGDRLWVRETWQEVGDAFYYRATDEKEHASVLGAWRPSIHMPRRASRITLEVVSVRVERLNEISEADAMAEGVRRVTKDNTVHKFCVYDRGDYSSVPWMDMPRTAVECYQSVWDSINGKRHPWASNPWVWVVEFRREKGGTP